MNKPIVYKLHISGFTATDVVKLEVYNDLQKLNAELLEALKAAVKTSKSESHPFRAWQALAESVIAKAEGAQ